MMWKRFIVSVCFALAIHTIFGCMWIETPMDELYTFKSYNIMNKGDYSPWYSWYEETESQRADNDANVAFWHTYTKGQVDKMSIFKALYQLPHSAIDNGNNPFFAYLKKQQDEAALNYWRITKQFSEKSSDPWYYPTLKDRAELLETAKSLRTASQQTTQPELRERYLLQLMRITFYLKEYTLCVQIWNDRPKTFKDADIQESFTNYYAGALLRLGEKTAAANLYGSTGEWKSLRIFPKDLGFMGELYETYPNSRAFEFFVQQFVNSYQDYRDTKQRDIFKKLANRALREQKTDDAALWQSALAHIAFLDGDVATAVATIEEASKMKGTPIVMENVRMLRLLYHAADSKAKDYDAKIAADLPWLIQKVYNLTDEERWVNCDVKCHYLNILRVITLKYLEPHYSSNGNPNMALAILNAYDEATKAPCDRDEVSQNRKGAPNTYNYDYNTHLFSYLDTTSITNAQNFLAFVKSGGKTELEKTLIKMGYVGESFMNELIGTKYMRISDYKNAIVHLQKVRPDFSKTQNIYKYLARNPFSEYWITNHRERKQYGTYNPAQIYEKNPSKLQFCQIMCELEQKIAESTDPEEKAQLTYAFCVGRIQSFDHLAWALTHYRQGFIYTVFDYYYDCDLHGGTDPWDYSASLTRQVQSTYYDLQKAEKLTRNPELFARCQYLQSYILSDVSFDEKMHCKLKEGFSNTQFYRNEIRHCDRLSDYSHRGIEW